MPNEVVEPPVISPDGNTVMIPLYNLGCAGTEPQGRTALIDVKSHAVSFIPSEFARVWLDDTHFVAEVFPQGPPPSVLGPTNDELDVVGLDGGHTLLGHGRAIGVLTAS